MSLINDALKQASVDQKKNPPPPAPLQFRAADESPRRSYTPPAILFAGLLVALALGGVLVGLALQKNPAAPLVVNARPYDAPATPVESPRPAPAAKLAADASLTAKPPVVAPSAPAPELSATTANSIETAPIAGVTNSVTVPAEPPPPVLPKLQGIAYNPSRPSAVVNGRTVYVGDRAGEFRVTQITPETVTLASAAETKVLSLSQ